MNDRLPFCAVIEIFTEKAEDIKGNLPATGWQPFHLR